MVRPRFASSRGGFRGVAANGTMLSSTRLVNTRTRKNCLRDSRPEQPFRDRVAQRVPLEHLRTGDNRQCRCKYEQETADPECCAHR